MLTREDIINQLEIMDNLITDNVKGTESAKKYIADYTALRINLINDIAKTQPQTTQIVQRIPYYEAPYTKPNDTNPLDITCNQVSE